MLIVALATCLGLGTLVFGALVLRQKQPAERAARLIAAGEYAEAVRTLAPAVASQPRDSQVHYYLGVAYAHLGMQEGAVRHFADAVSLAPGRTEYEVGLVAALLDAGRIEEAVARLREAVSRQPRTAALHLLLAATLKRAGDRDGMAAEYRTLSRVAAGTAIGEAARQELYATEWQTDRK